MASNLIVMASNLLVMASTYLGTFAESHEEFLFVIVAGDPSNACSVTDWMFFQRPFVITLPKTKDHV